MPERTLSEKVTNEVGLGSDVDMAFSNSFSNPAKAKPLASILKKEGQLPEGINQSFLKSHLRL